TRPAGAARCPGGGCGTVLQAGAAPPAGRGGPATPGPALARAACVPAARIHHSSESTGTPVAQATERASCSTSLKGVVLAVSKPVGPYSSSSISIARVVGGGVSDSFMLSATLRSKRKLVGP